MDEWVAVPADTHEDTAVGVALVTSSCKDRCLLDGSTPVSSALARHGERVCHSMTLAFEVVVALLNVAGLPWIVRSVRLGLRQASDSLFVRDCPSKALVSRWRAELGVVRGSGTVGMGDEEQARWEGVLLALPPNPLAQPIIQRSGRFGGVDIDPLRIIDALGFSQYLRAQEDFSKAMGAAHTYDHGGGPDYAPRDPKDDLGRTMLQASQKRLDVVTILLDRREFLADRACDKIAAIGLMSDSFPVAGEELQGMVLDIVTKPRGGRRIVLPGASISWLWRGYSQGGSPPLGLSVCQGQMD